MLRRWVLPILVLLLLASSACQAASPSRSPVDAGESRGAPAPAAPGATGSGNQQSAAQDRMVIYTSRMAIIVRDTQETVDAVTGLARDAGGYVVSTSVRWEGDVRVANMDVRVPASEHDSALTAIRHLAVKVEDDNTSSRDVTAEYVDLDAQLRNLQATESQYISLLAQARSIEDVLRVQERLTDVRGQIERLQGRLNLLRNQVDLATITIAIRPDTVDVGRLDWAPLRTAQRAWAESLVLLREMADLGISLMVSLSVVCLWWAVPLALLIRWLLSRRRRPPRPAGQGGARSSS